MREKMSNTLTSVGYVIERICHIHTTKGVRQKDLSVKIAAFYSLIFDFLIFCPITPLGQLVWNLGNIGNKIALVAAVSAEIALLVSDLHPEADFGPYFDEDGYDNVGEPRGEDW